MNWSEVIKQTFLEINMALKYFILHMSWFTIVNWFIMPFLCFILAMMLGALILFYIDDYRIKTYNDRSYVMFDPYYELEYKIHDKYNPE